MKPKYRFFPNGAWVRMEKSGPWYIVELFGDNGDTVCKMRCDTYAEGIDHYRTFKMKAATL